MDSWKIGLASAALCALAVGCQSPEEKERERQQQEEIRRQQVAERAERERLRQEKAEAERKRREEAAKARERYETGVAEKIKSAPPEVTPLTAVAAAPQEFAGKTVRVQAHWQENVGHGMHADELGGDPILIIGLTPLEKSRPKVFAALDGQEYQANVVGYSMLAPENRWEKGSKVEVILLVSGPPRGQLVCVARILHVRTLQ